MEIDLFLFCPMVSHYKSKEFKGVKIFTKNTPFMKDLNEKLFSHKSSQTICFELTQMIDHSYNIKIVKHIFGSCNNVSVWYFENVVTLKKDTSHNHIHWKRVHSFLKAVFSKQADTQGIDSVMRHKDTKCVEIIHIKTDTGNEKTIGCIVFQTFDAPPHGVVTFYVALSYKFKLNY